MADEATNVLGAAKTLSGLMQNLPSEPAPAEPEETTEEVVEDTGEVLGIRRNYEEADMMKKRNKYFVHYKSLPG